MRLANKTNPQTRNFGFSLVEAAIILGIIGLVIGGIWVAATAASENLKYTKIANNMLLVVQNIRAAYKNMPVSSDVYLTDFASNGDDIITRMGLAPADMISNTRLVDPWGNQINVILPANPTQADQIIVHFNNLTVARCMRLWVEFAVKNSRHMTGWLSSSSGSPLYVWDTAWGTAPHLNSTQCANGGYITMTFKRN